MPFELNAQIPFAVGASAPQIDPFAIQRQHQQAAMQRDEMTARRDYVRSQQAENEAQTLKLQREAAEAAALREAYKGGIPDQQTVFSIVGPVRGAEIFKAQQALQATDIKNAGDFMTLSGQVLGGIKALPTPELQQEMFGAARKSWIDRGFIKADQVPEKFSNEYADFALQSAMSAKDQAEANKPKTMEVGGAIVQVNPDGTTKDLRPATPKEAAAGSLEAYLDGIAQSKGLKSGRQLDPRAVLKARADYEAAGRAPSAPSQEPLVAIVGPDGKSVLVPRSQAVGKAPASTREVGRQVPATQAGTVADFDTALDDLSNLRKSLTETAGATGTLAKAGAMLPNFVTEATGLGAQSKKRQATIDYAKQVIGKALEGGVLRKEDEGKYEKILPTLSDPDDVALSKLDGLEKFITQRRGRFVDSLEDANYDVQNFRTRGSKTGAQPPPAGGQSPEEILRANGKPVTPANIAWVKAQQGR